MVDLDTGNFNFSRANATSSAEFRNQPLPNEQTLASDFVNYLNSKGLIREQLSGGRTHVEYDNRNSQNSETAVVSLWQIDVDGLPIVTDSYNHGLIKATITKNVLENEKFADLDYTYWQIDTTNSSTYPIKEPKQALDELKNGQGVVVTDPNTPKASISSLTLAYFLSSKYAPYLQPVYIFKGENFAALVPAISGDYLEKASGSK